MSFYYDEEDYGVKQQDDNEAAFLCVNCGGTTYYKEPDTGALCCDSCFTQSQAQPTDSAELDYTEVQALAARTRFGVITSSRTKKKRRGGRGRPLKEYDTSTPFPNLVTCIHGIQQVMKHGVESICDLVGLSGTQQKQVEATVKTLWMSYLRSWADGAEFYGNMHPEVRFSLRDHFLTSKHQQMVMRTLSYNAGIKVAAELRAEKKKLRAEKKKIDSSHTNDETPQTQGDRIAQENASGSVEREEEEDDKNEGVDTSWEDTHRGTIAYHSKHYHHRVTSLMAIYWGDKGKRGRLEAALTIVPSMKLVACLLWLAVSRAGVTLNQVLLWMSNGMLPLQNAYKLCLSDEEQKALSHVSTFFRMKRVPPLSQLERLTRKLVIACGLKSFSHLHGMPSRPLAEVVVDETGISKTTAKLRKRADFSFLTPQSVPLVTARLVDDLGFGQRILDVSFALMGVLQRAPSNVWLPGPLMCARPEKLWSTAHVLAVIVVACKMTPGWETWEYPLLRNEEIIVKAENMELKDESRAKKRQRVESRKPRFVPYNQEYFRLMSNGPLVEGYLDYLEENVLVEKTTGRQDYRAKRTRPIFLKFRKLLKSPSEKEVPQSASTETKGAVVRRQQILRGAHNPNQPKAMWRRQKFHAWNLLLAKKRARWADANGLGVYVAYSDPDTHRLVNLGACYGARKAVARAPEKFHPHYCILIEYMANKANVRPSMIHAVVTLLDEEIMSLRQRALGTQKKRKRRPK